MQMFVRGRNSNISVITSSQSTKLINKNNRMNSDFVFIGNNPGEARLDILETFLLGSDIPLPSNIKTKSQKLEYLNKFVLHYTNNYGFIVVNNIDHKIYSGKLNL